MGSRLAGHPQEHHLTCESRSAADLLAAHGMPGREAEVFARLPRSDNPDVGFVGDPDGPSSELPPSGYGVHAGPIAAALRSLGLPAQAQSGNDMSWLGAQTSAGKPVIAWVTGSCVSSRVSELRDKAGTTFRAVRGEHTVLVLAVRRDAVLVLDPADGRVAQIEADEFDRAWGLFDRAAVFVPTPAPAATPKAVHGAD